jgi:NAD(P)-dependent dehydrogenase (short-subunit alcohol dehydrogenase family)
MKLKGKVSVVTGGGRGIGKNIALAFAREGSVVVVAARSSDEIESTAHEIRQIGVDSIAVPTDVTRLNDVEKLVRIVTQRFNTIDILVNGAAIQGPIGSIIDAPNLEWEKTVQTNLVGLYYCCRTVLPIMIAQRRGKIINISGGGAVYPRPNFSAYSCSKAAVVRLTETLAEELRNHNIQINTMSPGASRTRMTEEIIEAGRAAGEEELLHAKSLLRDGGIDPEKQARLVVFLASKESDGLSGRMLHANEDWPSIAGRIPEVMSGELYTVRRVSPLTKS